MESIYKLLYSEEYNEELTGIYTYVSTKLNEENVAKKLITKIRKEILRLQYFPKENKVIVRQGKNELYRLIILKSKQFIYYIFLIQNKII